MGAARFAVQDPLAAVNSADPAAGRPGKALLIIRALVAPGPGSRYHGSFLTDSLEGFRVGCHGFGREAVYTFDIVFTQCDGQGQRFLFTGGFQHKQLSLSCFITAKTNHKVAIR